MDNVDITDLSKIYSQITKENYQEVLSDYFNGNFRSAIVVLYPLVISDLLLKLKDLASIYDDASAKSILHEIEKSKSSGFKENKTTKSRWEKQLIDNIYKKTELLSVDEYTEISHIYDHRCLSAHPTLNDDYELIEPSKEQILSDIKSAYSSIFIKSPILISNVIDKLTDDLAEKKNIFEGDVSQLDTYLRNNYFLHMNAKMIEKTFKALWKFCFVSNTDTNFDENRTINRRALETLLSDHFDLLLDKIRTEQNLFKLSNKEDCIFQLCIVLAKYPTIYECLAKEVQLILLNSIKDNVNLKAFCWFISTKQKNISDLEEYIDEKPFSELYPNVLKFCNDSYINAGLSDCYLDFCIKYFSYSYNYDSADERYQYAISTNLKFMSKNQFLSLLAVIESNDQIYGRRNNNDCCKEILEVINNKYKDEIEFTKFKHFIPSQTVNSESKITI